MNFNIFETAKDHIVITAHRGVSGGNIPCNTITAYEIALKQGADMIEVDLNKSADGVLIIFHPDMEPHHLGLNRKLPEMTYEEIREVRYRNYDHSPTQFGIATFEEILERFKGRCYINVDKFWDHPVEIYRAIKRHNMLDQVVVKSGLSDRVLRVLEEVAPDVAFFPIVKNTFPQHEDLLRRNVNYVGAEVIFESENAEVAKPELIEKIHRDGKLIWVNSIIYNYRSQLTAGHSDDTALSENPDLGWGWLADRGYDIIQTDWPQMLIDYLKQNEKYSRRSRAERFQWKDGRVAKKPERS